VEMATMAGHAITAGMGLDGKQPEN
jgi:hypothetical protein